MYFCIFARLILKKPRPSYVSVNTCYFSSQRISRPSKPITQIHRKVKKSPKSSLKNEFIEPIVYKSEVIPKVYSILKYSTWDCAQEQLENLPIKWDSYAVNQVLKTHPPMEKAWLFFNWAARRKNFKHDQYTYTTMLDIFGEARRVSSMNFVFEQMKEKGIKIDVVTYTSLMHWMSKDGNVDGAIKVWKEMKEKGCDPTVVSYTAYMKILFDHKRVNEATCVYREMLQSGLSPNVYTYTVLMDYLACSGKVEEALEIFKRMQEAGVQPEKATCNILIEICSTRGETWAMMKILQYMKESSIVLRYPVYQKALEAFKMAGESDFLLRQVHQHLNNECPDKFYAMPPESDSTIDNGIALNLLNKQNLVAVDSLLTDTMRKGIPLDGEVLSKIVEVNCINSRQNHALLAFEYCVELGIAVDRTALLALIGLAVRTNSFQNVMKVVEEMVKQGQSLGAHLNSLLIYRLGCNKELVSAVKIFDLLPDEEKGTSEFTALIGAYFSCGIVDKALEQFEIMRSKGVKIALGTYCVLITGLEKCGRAREADCYRKEKKRLKSETCARDVSMEETVCNIVFARGTRKKNMFK
ncbi:pentatricopeptide repeat-containing protein At2g01390 [Primulina eburnea]|uniref:pentatricopeptide repeat-containing protein At2g01390 n=1 Tax=Primulina eburnea TaxID=1245227 RepID=UPI003C6CBCCF